MGILNTTSGVRNVHRNLKFGYFSQHHVDQLEMNLSSVELLQSSFPGLLLHLLYFNINNTNYVYLMYAIYVDNRHQENPLKNTDVSWEVLVYLVIWPYKVLAVYLEVKNQEQHLLGCACQIQISQYLTNLPIIQILKQLKLLAKLYKNIRYVLELKLYCFLNVYIILSVYTEYV